MIVEFVSCLKVFWQLGGCRQSRILFLLVAHLSFHLVNSKDLLKIKKFSQVSMRLFLQLHEGSSGDVGPTQGPMGELVHIHLPYL